MGIRTFQDLINLFPNRYIDRTRFYKTTELQPSNSEVQIIGQITGFKEIAQKRGKRLPLLEMIQASLNWFGLGGINGFGST